ncbi:MAG TPA: hypothetical protein VIH99_04825, partial [Bdellovibrionota bacterium]
MDSLKTLGDKELLLRTLELAAKTRQATVELLRHMREVERRQLHLTLGHSSMYDYVIKELKYSEGGAYRRIQAMRLLRDVPEAAQKIEEGTLTICTAAKVQTASGKSPGEDKGKILASVEGKTTREAERELAKLDPRGPREFTRWLNSNEV